MMQGGKNACSASSAGVNTGGGVCARSDLMIFEELVSLLVHERDKCNKNFFYILVDVLLSVPFAC